MSHLQHFVSRIGQLLPAHDFDGLRRFRLFHHLSIGVEKRLDFAIGAVFPGYQKGAVFHRSPFYQNRRQFSTTLHLPSFDHRRLHRAYQEETEDDDKTA